MILILECVMHTNAEAQILDYKLNYGINNYFEKQILYKNIYKAKEELFKKLRVKRVSVAGRNIEYFINREGRTDTILMKVVFQSSGPNMYEVEKTKQERHQPPERKHVNTEVYSYNTNGNLIQINASDAFYNNLFGDAASPRKINFFYTDNILTGLKEEYNGSGSDKDIFVTYNEKGLLSGIISVGRNKSDTVLTNFIYDENKSLVFIGRDSSSAYGYKFIYKGDTIAKITNNSWGEEIVIEGNRPVKIISYAGVNSGVNSEINSKENTAYSTEEYFYNENGLPDKIVYTDKDGSKTEVNFDYEYYKD